MRLNKRSILRLLVLVLICCFCTSFVRQDNANAYFHTNQSKTAQCFAVAYKQDKSDSNTTYHSHGEEVTTGETFGGVWSTNKICAYINNDGKVTGGLTYSGKRPPGTSAISGYPKLILSKDKKGIIIQYCSKGGNNCKLDLNADSPVSQDIPAWETNSPTNNTVLTKEFKVDGYDTFYALAKAVNDFAQNKYLDATKLALDENTTTDEVIGWDNDTDPKYEGNCRSGGGAGALGWVVCPILDWMGKTASDVYNLYVEPSLQIDPQLFSGGNESVRQAWGTFQSIANILFVILFLIVIFSQLTGIGIDNYGIKRILPKLIVVAILINLSYFICLLLVDVSNILGNSFQDLFKGMENALGKMPESITIESNPIKTGAITGITGVGLLGAIVAGGAAILANPAILLSMLVSALGIIIAVFFLFILLSAREAAIIVLVVISPIAVVLYALPNTKKFFDKWYKMFEGLLLVYPICGLLVGAGGYTSKLVLLANGGSGDNGFIGAFTAMIISIIPVFFIPIVLRGAFAAMGNLGSMIHGIGQRVRGGTTNFARNTGAYKNIQQAGLERQTRIRAGLDAEGNPVDGWRRRVGTVLSGGRMSRQRNALQYQRMLSERGSLEATEGPDFMLDTQAGNILKEIQADGTINNDARLRDRLVSSLRNNDRAGIKAYTDALSAKGESGRDLVKGAYNTVAGQLSDDAARAFAANIMTNHAADYKNNSRELFNVVSDINTQNPQFSRNQQGGYMTTMNYAQGHRNALQTATKTETMGAMDDTSFAQTFLGGAAYDDGRGNINIGNVSLGTNLTQGQIDAIGNNAYNALKNSKDMNANRVAYVNAVLDECQRRGYTRPVQDVNVV